MTLSMNMTGIFLAAHNQDTGLRFWDIRRWEREIGDLKSMGAETLWYLPIQFGQRSVSDFLPGSDHWKLQKQISSAIAEAGLKVGIYAGLNDVFPETLEAHLELAAESGKYFLEEAHACPSIQAAWQEIMELRARLFGDLPRIDYLIIPATDYGGCSCMKCHPWPGTYINKFQEQAALCRSFHPQVKIVAAGHGLEAEEEDMLRGLVAGSGWIDCVADIPRRTGKPVVKYYMAPEITMLDGWGKYGPCPVLPTIEKCYQLDREDFGGGVAYSEGIHDDINKYACLKMAQSDENSAHDVAMGYCQNWLGLNQVHAGLAASAILKMGALVTNSHIYLDPEEEVGDGVAADERLCCFRDLRQSNSHLEGNHRYWLLVWRAVCESLASSAGTLLLHQIEEEAAHALEALTRLEPEYASFLQKQHPAYRPERGAWVWPRKFRQNWKIEQQTNP